MTISREQRFLSRIQSALKVSLGSKRRFNAIFPGQSDEEVHHLVQHITHRKKDEQQQLLDNLIEAARPINLKVLPVADMATATKKIKGLIINKEPEWDRQKHVAVWCHPLIDQLNLSQALVDEDISFYPTCLPNNDAQTNARQQIRDEIITSFIGITSADYCVAESATLVMKTLPGQARATSLVPSIHIAVIRMNQVIANLKELYTLLTQEPDFDRQGLTNCLTFISGPSKTADIEAVMVHGAHGPREVYLYVITSDQV